MNPYAVSKHYRLGCSSRRWAKLFPDRHPRGFNLLELLTVIVVVVIAASVFVGLLFPTGCCPPQSETQRVLTSIEMALTVCATETGNAPTTVDCLKLLAGRYLEVSSDRSDLLTQMVMTGKDHWGNRLRIEADDAEPGCYILRCLGPDGVVGTGLESDDIIIRYSGGTSADASVQQKPNQQADTDQVADAFETGNMEERRRSR